VRRAAAGLLALAALAAAPGRAHPLAPSLLELEERGSGQVVARLTEPRFAGAGRTEVRLPARCRPLEAPRARAAGERMLSEQSLDCGAAGLAGAEIAVAGLSESRTDVILQITREGGGGHEALLSAQRPAFRVPERAGAARVWLDYGRLGAEHLAGGLDHLLFVAGLFLLAGGVRASLGTLSAFTFGHSVTLGLVALGAAAPPGAAVEVGIAASLVVQALGLASRKPGRRGLLERRPWLLAAGFGLLHGMGFAGALREIGLPDHAVATALLAFNAGIEAAQIGFVALLAVAARGLAAARLPAARWPAHALGGLGAFLVLDRLASWLAP
jgi:hypothetical protein